jgi:hypothetical protein
MAVIPAKAGIQRHAMQAADEALHGISAFAGMALAFIRDCFKKASC